MNRGLIAGHHLVRLYSFRCLVKQRYCSVAQANKKLPNSVKLRRIALIRELQNNNDELKALLQPFEHMVNEKEKSLNLLKESNANEADLLKANEQLNIAKQQLQDKQYSISMREDFRKYLIYDLIKRRFINNSFEIYGGFSRVYDFGPLATKIYDNIIEFWKLFFVKEDRCLHVKCPVLTPEKVLTTSGHVQRFCDVYVKDITTGDLYRLDHLITNTITERLSEKKLSSELELEYKNILSSLNQLTKDEMCDILSKYSITSPVSGNELSAPFERNLMFKTSVGVNEDVVYLRPELSQSAFINFHKYYEYKKLKLPFAVSQIGSAFRNELSRSTGITRIREFTLAEIQYFFDPQKRVHPKFDTVKNVELNLYSACNQRENKESECMTLEQAVNNGLIDQIMGYYFVRIQLFLTKIGIDVKRLRYRQHLSNELAHYSKNCWDAECLTYGGWLECIGISDRNCFDLENHSNASKTKLTFKRQLNTPVLRECIDFEFGEGVNEAIKESLLKLSEEDKIRIECELKAHQECYIKSEGRTFCLRNEDVKIAKTMKSFDKEDVYASVIEPSFGIERLMHTLFDHNLKIRKNDERKAYFSFPCSVSPLKCCILPLGSNDEFAPLVSRIDDILYSQGIDCEIDDSRHSIGLRYVRSDEIGTPFAVTVDFDSLQEPHTVTLRDRDSTKQVRIPIDNLADILKKLSSDSISFENICELYPTFKGQTVKKSANYSVK